MCIRDRYKTMLCIYLMTSFVRYVKLCQTTEDKKTSRHHFWYLLEYSDIIQYRYTREEFLQPKLNVDIYFMISCCWWWGLYFDKSLYFDKVRSHIYCQWILINLDILETKQLNVLSVNYNRKERMTEDSVFLLLESKE